MIRTDPRGPAFAGFVGTALVPYGSFIVFIEITSSTVSYPLTVDIVETPESPITVGSYTLNSGGIIDLTHDTDIYDPHAPLHHSYEVSRLSSFEMRWSYISFRVRIKNDAASLRDFKGSTASITVSDAGSVVENANIMILNSDPNNHFHWKRELGFVDGWYFKCVHVDSTSRVATPFFFLYGVNDPAGGTHAESFVMCTNAGSVTLSASHTVPPTATPSAYDTNLWNYPSSHFSCDRLWGLRANIGSDFSATGIRCTGTKLLGGGNTIDWDLNFTKIHAHSKTDWDPFSDHETPIDIITGGLGYIDFPGNPLLHYLNFVPGLSAYYMSHNMNSFVSGTINWRGSTYTFVNDKGYQDENWGSGGFPHPYVWMQANNFRNSSGAVLTDTSIVAIYTPGMPTIIGNSTVGGICLRYDGHIYKFFSIDSSVFGSAPAFVIDTISSVGPVECTVEFIQGGIVKTVNLEDPANVTSIIGAFPRTSPAKPIRWIMTGRNDAGWIPGTGDEITIEVECDASTVMSIAAPMGGRMTANVTKETLHGKMTVTLTPIGESSIILYSDFCTAEFGD